MSLATETVAEMTSYLRKEKKKLEFALKRIPPRLWRAERANSSELKINTKSVGKYSNY